MNTNEIEPLLGTLCFWYKYSNTMFRPGLALRRSEISV
jgi:hypothetical protein